MRTFSATLVSCVVISVVTAAEPGPSCRSSSAVALVSLAATSPLATVVVVVVADTTLPAGSVLGSVADGVSLFGASPAVAPPPRALVSVLVALPVSEVRAPVTLAVCSATAPSGILLFTPCGSCSCYECIETLHLIM
jgi:hypothetical protein